MLPATARAPRPTRWLTVLGLVAFVAVWQAVVWLADYPAFILPSPMQVLTKFVRVAGSGLLWRHLSVTLLEVVLGFSLGFATATVLGYWFAKRPLAEELVSPYVVAMQAIPVVAVAPLLVIWFGSGLLSKVLVCALIVFFPVLVNTIVGVRSVDAVWLELMRALNATPWQTFLKVEVPGSLPVILGGLKLGVTLAVVGAVVGEFVGAERGLGALIKISSSLFDTPQLFVALLTLAAMALTLYGGVVFLERSVVTWRR
ncbi:MAG TPA: ABC transporter permease [Chloroflexi bacterium]|nr:ABC transporter permease [Chloroflexota bacterium]